MKRIKPFLERNADLNRRIRNYWLIIGICSFIAVLFFGDSQKNFFLLVVLSLGPFLLALLHYTLFVLGESCEDDDNMFIKIQENSNELLKQRLNAKVVAFERHKE